MESPEESNKVSQLCQKMLATTLGRCILNKQRMPEKGRGLCREYYSSTVAASAFGQIARGY